MESTLLYFIKANIITSLLYGFYWLLLRNEKQFALNRFILMGCIFAGLLLPLIPGSVYFFSMLRTRMAIPATLAAIYNTPGAVQNTAVQAAGSAITTAAGKPGLTFLQAACPGYLLVAAVLLGRFVKQLFALAQLVKVAAPQKFDGVIYLHHGRQLPPFSFFNYLVVNKKQYTADEYTQILAHEQVHIQQYHTIDVLLAEIMAIACWINPVTHLLKRSIILNLEYLADDKVVQCGFDKKAYQLNILHRCLNSNEYKLANLFTSSKIKMRIKMMNTQKPGGGKWYKYALVLPALFAGYLIINPVNARTPLKSAAGKDKQFRFEKLYVVLNAGTDKEQLVKIMDNLLLWGVDFKRTSEHFNADGHLLDIEVKFSVPGAFNGAVSSGSSNGVLAKPVIFYYEPATGFHVSTGLVPDDMSAEGKKIVTNNLNGLLIIYKGGRELSGSCRWD